jgi:hypothetical protein
MVSRWGYADSWDDFMVKLNKYSRKQRESFIEECTRGSGRIGMIETLSQEWRTTSSKKRAAAMVGTRRRRLIESVRWMPQVSQFRPYVSLEFRATMPEPSAHKTTPVRTRDNDRQARNFFRQPTPGVLHGKRVEVIIRQTYRLSVQAWAGAHPYGPRPGDEDLRLLRAQFYTPSKKKPIGGFDPAGMTPERAIEIALRVLGRVS